MRFSTFIVISISNAITFLSRIVILLYQTVTFTKHGIKLPFQKVILKSQPYF